MLPDYWLKRPPAVARDDADAGNPPIWQALCERAGERPIVFHGTGSATIERFEPRAPIDVTAFGAQHAVYATSDPIWAMFYAIIDRDRFPMTLNNGCARLEEPSGRLGDPHYYFSITRAALEQQPWRPGYVYLLPAETFVEQPALTFAGMTAHIPQLASPTTVIPFSRVQVTPADFPFLADIRGHDDDRLAEYAQAIMSAGPWPD